MIVGILLILKRETPVTDVVQILEPLKVGHGHTSSIDVEILRREESERGT